MLICNLSDCQSLNRFGMKFGGVMKGNVRDVNQSAIWNSIILFRFLDEAVTLHETYNCSAKTVTDRKAIILVDSPL